MNKNFSEKQKKILRLFASFLKKRNIYGIYKSYLAKYEFRTVDGASVVLNPKQSFFGHLLVSAAFTWDFTKEGTFFWGKVNEEWALVLNYWEKENL